MRLVIAITLLLLAAQPARADEFATLVAALAGDSFADKERAVSALGKLGDRRGGAVLTALQDGHLLRGPSRPEAMARDRHAVDSRPYAAASRRAGRRHDGPRDRGGR